METGREFLIKRKLECKATVNFVIRVFMQRKIFCTVVKDINPNCSTVIAVCYQN